MARSELMFHADELLALALHDLEKEQVSDALEKLKAAVGLTDCPPMVYAELGRLYSKLRLFHRAKPMFERYLELQPGAITELFQLGMAHFESNDVSDATALWDEVLRLAPLHPPALFFSSLQSAKQGDLIRAYGACERLISEIAKDNLYFGRAKELMLQIEADPAYQRARQETASIQKPH